MSHNNNFPIALQCHTLTLACSRAYRSIHFAVAMETRVQAAVRVIAHESKSIDTADVGVSCDHNLAIALCCHAIAVGVTLSSKGRVAEHVEPGATMEDEEPGRSFHLTDRKICQEKRISIRHRKRQKVKPQPSSGRSDKS